MFVLNAIWSFGSFVLFQRAFRIFLDIFIVLIICHDELVRVALQLSTGFSPVSYRDFFTLFSALCCLQKIRKIPKVRILHFFVLPSASCCLQKIRKVPKVRACCYFLVLPSASCYLQKICKRFRRFVHRDFLIHFCSCC